MHKVTPTKHQDGTETVRLYGATVDVAGKSKFTLFKKDYKVVRSKAKKSNAGGGNGQNPKDSDETKPQDKPTEKTKSTSDSKQGAGRQSSSLNDEADESDK